MKNGLNASALSEFVHEARSEPRQAQAAYGVAVRWETATRLEASARSMSLGPHRLARSFRWGIDEPRQLLGTNRAANPQELLLSGFGACLMIAFALGATARGVQLELLELEVQAELDLRGFLGVAGAPSVGFRQIDYRLRVAADAEARVLEELHQRALEHSPNAQTLARAVELRGELEIQE